MLGSKMKVNIEPIYGNGWTDGAQTVDVPACFKSNVAQLGTTFSGKVETQGHKLEGFTFAASKRSDIDDGHYNIQIRGPKGDILSGYCIVRSV